MEDISIKEIAKGAGEPINILLLYYSLNMVLRNTNCKINIENIAEQKLVIIHCSEVIPRTQIQKLKKVIFGFEYHAIYHFVYSPNYKDKIQMESEGIRTLPSRLLPRNFDKSLLKAVEEDEDFWIDNKSVIYESTKLNISDIIPRSWIKGNHLTGFINGSINVYDNIRNFFTLYESLIIALPLSDFNVDFFNSIGITEEEFFRLYECGKIKIIVPQCISRYRIEFLTKLVNIDVDNIIFCRKLSACSLIETRNRFPFLYPNIGSTERYQVLSALSSAFLNSQNIGLRNWGISLIEALSINYLDSNYHLDHKGAMGVSITGMTNLFSTTFKAITGKDYFLEMLSAGNYVEWSSPFKSVIITPKTHNNYDERNNVQIMANFYSTIKKVPLSKIENEDEIISGILTIDEGVDIVDLARSFHSKDVLNFRSLINDIDNQNNKQDITEKIRKFNSEVEKYERHRERLRRIDVAGLLSGVTGVAGSIVTIGTPIASIPIASLSILIWLEKLLYSNRNSNRILSKFYDSIDKAICSTDSKTVLVSRLKESIHA